MTIFRWELGLLAMAGLAVAADQSKVGEGNARAVQISAGSPRVQQAHAYLRSRLSRIQDGKLRANTTAILSDPEVCVASKSGLTARKKEAILRKLQSEGLISSPIDERMMSGIFPPLRDEAGDCPKLPQPYSSAPGSAFGGHHSHPGGLAVHASFNLTNALSLAQGYRTVYGPDVFISEDLMIAAPIWHDWAKTMVFQWNADGTEFAEYNFGGNGKTDAWGEAGDSRTGAHHILGLAEIIKRGLPPEFLVTVASAHAAPASGNEYKVVNWIRTAAIVAGVDAVSAGYLSKDSQERLRLPAVRSWDEPGHLLVEYMLHNLSDADFVWTGPAASAADQALKKLAGKFGFDVGNVAEFNNQFRNPVLAHLTAERLLMLQSNGGTAAVAAEVTKALGR